MKLRKTVAIAVTLTVLVAGSVLASHSADNWDVFNRNGAKTNEYVEEVGDCLIVRRHSDGRVLRTLTPTGVLPSGCAPSPATTTTTTSTTTSTTTTSTTTTSTTTTSSTTTSTTTPPTTTPPTTVPSGGYDFPLIPVGAPLPSAAFCASVVTPTAEPFPVNSGYNVTPGSGTPNGRYPRVLGDFTGTTDEIIQWAACKWGVELDFVKTQVWGESNWRQNVLGDFTSDAGACIPGFPIGTYPPQYNGDANHVNQCPESVGLMQDRWLYHMEAFEDDNAVQSSAYNIDYGYAVWRSCFEGEMTWLNTVEGRGDYVAGDAVGCSGVWFSGRWYTSAAVGYIGYLANILATRPWPNAGPPPTTTTTTVAPPTTTTAPPTTTIVPAGGSFVEDFTGDVGLSRFDYGIWNREGSGGSVQGDHNLACGDATTSRVVTNDVNSVFYLCRDHLMTTVGDWSGYSVAWFTPNETFDNQTTVSWDVNVTDLKARQWWEVSIVPASFNSGFSGCPQCSVIDWLSPDPAHLPAYPNGSVVVGNGPFGKDVHITYQGQNQYGGWQKTCGASWDMFEASGACGSKAIRLPFSIVDNADGTITVDYGGGWVETFPGSFPSQFNVVFKDHNYTPDKDGTPLGHTWHFDNIAVG
jgi:hypothetical protein